MMTLAMAGRRVLIVGGAAGIGRATARLCLEAGARVAVIDRDLWRNEGDDVAPTLTLRADVRSAAEVNIGVAATVAGLGGLDGIVYCAGVDLIAKLVDTSDEDWERVLDVNVTGAMRVCRAALRHFAPEGGTIVLVASAAALRPLADRAAYCVSKAALVTLAKSLAAELGPRRIRVNALCPGAVETALFRSSLKRAADPASARAAISERYALRRIAAPEEMATTILFLSSAASSYVTGAALAADGGDSFD
jgi:NAD(P)-dependent dehydrogenase (short-subunit alcohol dehydrogenase family)